jgi:hypothetical protein
MFFSVTVTSLSVSRILYNSARYLQRLQEAEERNQELTQNVSGGEYYSGFH